ncbi:MAG: UbiA family prenyltransferase [Halobacteriota archaeon]
MSNRRSPSFFSSAAPEEEFIGLFRLPQPRAWLENVFSFVTLTSIFIGAVMAAILYFSFLLQSISSSTLLLLATFFLAISVYSLNKVTDLEEDSINLPNRARFVKKNRDLLLFVSLESINIAVVLAFFSNPYAIVLVLFPFYIGALYSIGVRRLRIKNVLLVKNIIAAATCTVAAVLLPLAVHVDIPLIVLMVAYFIFLKLFINSVLFDVRDIEGDRKAGVQTIPVSLGRKKTRNLLLLLNSTLIVWIAFSLFQGLFYPYHFVLILSVLYGYWYILRFTRATAKTSRLLDLLVDGEWMILAMYATPFALGWPHVI